ncbi:hypothetical protein [Haloferula rosea]|nr:hypothetical protein [Haloferula rosea]
MPIRQKAMRFSLLHLTAASLLAIPTWAANSQAIFQGLGDLSGGANSSSATGVSEDGITVSGISSSTAGTEAFKWTEVGGLVVLSDIEGGNVSAGAMGVSSNGAMTCGFGTFGTGVVRATRWDGTAAPTQLGTLNTSGYRYSQGAGISADGSRVVGISSSASGLRAFVWVSGTGMSNLGFLIPNATQSGDFAYSSEANAISSNGQTVVGSSSYTVSETVTIPGRTEQLPRYDDEGNLIGYETIYYPPYDQTTVLEQGTQAFSWTSAGGMVALGDLSGGGLFSEANAISNDGTVIVGGGQHGAGNEGVVWTNGVISSIGDFDGGDTASLLTDVTADGTIAVGQGTDALGEAALIWSSEFGIGNLNTLLAEQGVNLGGWRLTSATGISSDGQVIVGNGINPSGDPEAWRITDALSLLNILIPPPAGLQESLKVVRGHAARFSAERGRSYQLLESTNLATWTTEGELFSTTNAGEAFEHALPITLEPSSSFYLLGPSSVPSEADTPITMIQGTLLQFTSERGYIYQPAYSDDLVTWTPFGSPLNTSSDLGPVERTFIDTSVSLDHPKRFYRIDTTQSDTLTVPFDLHVGPVFKVNMQLDTPYQLQTRPRFTNDPWENLGEPFSTEGAATPHSYFTAMPLPRPSFRVVTPSSGEPLADQTILTLADGALISFTSQPGSAYQVQKTTDGVTFANVGAAIDTVSDTGPTSRNILDPFDSTNPPVGVSYRVVETGLEP